MGTVRTAGVMLLAFAGIANAGNLCDLQCRLEIDFPQGGSIDAVAELLITFGESGLVDTGGSVTAYVDGETLLLNTGGSLVFAAGGHFSLGNGGNIDYTDMRIVTDGSIRLEAIGGNETVTIDEGSNLSLDGAGPTLGGSVDLSGSLTIDGVNLEPGGGSTLVLTTSDLTPASACMLGQTLVLDPDASLAPGEAAACEPLGPGSIDAENGVLLIDTGAEGEGGETSVELVLPGGEGDGSAPGASAESGAADGATSTAAAPAWLILSLIGLLAASRLRFRYA